MMETIRDTKKIPFSRRVFLPFFLTSSKNIRSASSQLRHDICDALIEFLPRLCVLLSPEFMKDHTVFKDQDPGAEARCIRIMRDHEYRSLLLIVQFFQFLKKRPRILRVQRTRRLISEYDRRIEDQG